MTNVIDFPKRKTPKPVIYTDGENIFDFVDPMRCYVAGDLDLILMPHDQYPDMRPGISALVAVRDVDGIEGYFRQFKGSAHLKRFIVKLIEIQKRMATYEETIK